ncbi:hypothetical protein SLS55_001374 [Diplodia seriata]|uniref:Uncharacterized protein n=1 Tax=Diplodia seriata TaxID=420778 RepID=A0ABR3CWW7_9PEZI
MACECLHDTVGCMAFYTLKPVLICHAILSTSWKVALMVKGLAAENAAYSAAQSLLPPPTTRTFAPRPRSQYIFEDRPAPVSTHGQSIDSLLQEQLAQLEAEKAQQRWSSPPSYRLYDDAPEKPPPPQLSPRELNFPRKPFAARGGLEKEIRITVYPVEEDSPLNTPFQSRFGEQMSYVAVAT